MFAVIVSEKGGGTERHEFQQNEVTIGRVQGNDIILGKGNVSKRHSRLVLKDGRYIVVDLKSTNGTYVNGRKVTSPLVVKAGDKIYIGDFTLTIEGQAGTNTSVPARAGGSDPSPVHAPGIPSPPPVAPPPPAVMPSSGPPPGPAVAPPRPASNPASSSQPLGPAHRTGTSSHEVGKPVPKTWEPPRRGEIFDAGSRPATPRPPIGEIGSRGAPTKHTSAFEAMSLLIGDRNLRTVLAGLDGEVDLHETSAEAMRDPRRWTDVEQRVERVIHRLAADGQIEEVDLATLAAAAVREAVGLGVLESLLADERVREILVSSPAEVWVDYGQGPELAVGAFSDARMMLTVVRRLAAQAGVMLDRTTHVHEFLLPAGSHVTVVMPPVATMGPVVEIRRVHAGPSLDDLVANHSLASESRSAIVRAVHAGRTIAVVGPSGSGVTTLLAAIAASFPADQRVVVVSAIADVRLERPNTVTLAAGLGPGRPSFRELVGQAGRLRADRLVVDGVGPAELALALSMFAGRRGGDLLGVRARLGDSSLDALRRMLEREGAQADAADALLADGISLVVEMDAAHGLRRVRRVVDIRVGAGGRLEFADHG